MTFDIKMTVLNCTIRYIKHEIVCVEQYCNCFVIPVVCTLVCFWKKKNLKPLILNMKIYKL